jgi:hypothetical protein
VPFDCRSLYDNPQLRRTAEGNAAAAETDPRAAELERAMAVHADATKHCEVLGLNVAALEPVALKEPKKKKAPKPAETTFTVPESPLDLEIRAIVGPGLPHDIGGHVLGLWSEGHD